jgi:hypothetical protein
MPVIGLLGLLRSLSPVIGLLESLVLLVQRGNDIPLITLLRKIKKRELLGNARDVLRWVTIPLLLLRT